MGPQWHPSGSKRATIATARLLDSHSGGENLMMAKSKTGTLLDNATNIGTVSRFPKNTVMAPLTMME